MRKRRTYAIDVDEQVRDDINQINHARVRDRRRRRKNISSTSRP